MWRALVLCAALVGAVPAGAQQAETLADIRQDLAVLNVEIQRLRTELSTTSGPTIPAGGSLLERVTLIEGELQRLTSKTEELEFRINRIVQDGTNRIGDLEFRLVELEGGDLSQLGETSTLGGEAAVPPPVAQGGAATPGGEVAVAEQADLDAARALLESGDPGASAEAFAAFLETYPGSPFEIDALLGRGDALSELGDAREAGRAYLAAYNADPVGPTAPVALLRLGRGLDALGRADAACQILGQLAASFPAAPEAPEAAESQRSIGCP